MLKINGFVKELTPPQYWHNPYLEAPLHSLAKDAKRFGDKETEVFPK